ncbi:hypothetical protein [Neorhizobium galegae]|uniref:hypothetical protein n=1 Tax=Neorhizobium galegae TaxID=399 RepID=UPI0006220F6D|nr:hypothetical protein [Neorhizobium galegae]KAB1126305.1 hypothetical protein F4V90_04100 [Neorhizobium galegae]MCQ1805277.1 hypothetical protein [Neorhizobium galegae]CDZ56038.1 Hypothetical protein NGAL_HAMBI2566_05880 [Neorhizobium galegae bv. orientalis]
MRLRAVQSNATSAIVVALRSQNLSNLAEKLGYTGKKANARLADIATGVVDPTTEECAQITAVLSAGTLCFDAEKDAITMDAVNSLRAALIGRNLKHVEEGAKIPTMLLDRFLGGNDCLSEKQLDILIISVLGGALKIDHETGTLVPRGYIEVTAAEAAANRNPLRRLLDPDMVPADREAHAHVAAIPLGVVPPVAQGSALIDAQACVLKSEEYGEGFKRIAKAESRLGYMHAN